MKRYILTCVFIVGFCINSWGSDPDNIQLNEKFDTKKGFTLYLPSGWVQIPQEELENYEKNVNDTLAPDVPIRYDLGFQIDTDNNWFTYPYILTQVDSEGKISEKTFTEELGGAIKKGTGLEKNEHIDEIKIGAPQYDKDTYTMWTHNRATVGYNTIHSVSAIIMTEKGFVSVHTYLLDGQVDKYFPIIKKIVSGIAFHPGYKYNPEAFSVSVFLASQSKRTIMFIMFGAFILSIVSIVLLMVLLLSFRSDARVKRPIKAPAPKKEEKEEIRARVLPEEPAKKPAKKPAATEKMPSDKPRAQKTGKKTVVKKRPAAKPASKSPDEKKRVSRSTKKKPKSPPKKK